MWHKDPPPGQGFGELRCEPCNLIVPTQGFRTDHAPIGEVEKLKAELVGVINTPAFLNEWQNVGGVVERPLAFDSEPIVGWRVWKLIAYRRRDGTVEPRLAQISGSVVWPPYERAIAVCTRRLGIVEAHEAPAHGCQCGFWSFRTRTEAEELAGTTSGVTVFGEVKLWGGVLEFEKGYRAQYAYPKLLYIYASDNQIVEGRSIGEQLADVYGVEARAIPAMAPSTIPPGYFIPRVFADQVIKGVTGMNDAAMAFSLAVQESSKKISELTRQLEKVPSFRELLPLAAGGLDIVDVYPRADAAARRADEVERELHERGLKHRRVSRFRFVFPSGGAYTLIGCQMRDLWQQLAGRNPDIIDLPPGAPPDVAAYFRAHGARVIGG